MQNGDYWTTPLCYLFFIDFSSVGLRANIISTDYILYEMWTQNKTAVTPMETSPQLKSYIGVCLISQGLLLRCQCYRLWLRRRRRRRERNPDMVWAQFEICSCYFRWFWAVKNIRCCLWTSLTGFSRTCPMVFPMAVRDLSVVQLKVFQKRKRKAHGAHLEVVWHQSNFRLKSFKDGKDNLLAQI